LDLLFDAILDLGLDQARLIFVLLSLFIFGFTKVVIDDLQPDRGQML
jgi:hypothetical protein